MNIWLVVQAHSSTALAGLILGSGLILIFQLSTVQRNALAVGLLGIVLSTLPLAIYTMPGTFDFVIKALGRDSTLTGRTEMWADLLNAPINPIIGAGYQSFWMGPYASQMWQKYSFRPNQAHNGYLETYLQGGLIAVGLLLIVLLSAFVRLRKRIINGDRQAILLFAFLITTLFYNWTEAFFNSLSPMWMMLLFGAVTYSIEPDSRPAVFRKLQPASKRLVVGYARKSLRPQLPEQDNA